MKQARLLIAIAFAATLLIAGFVYVAINMKWNGPTHYYSVTLDSTPAGKKVLYSLDSQSYLAVDGVISQIADGSCPRFGRNEREIFYEGETGAISRKDLKTGIVKQVTNPDDNSEDNQIAFDPKSNLVVFTRLTQTPLGSQRRSYDLYACNPDGSNLRRLTNRKAWVMHLGAQSVAKGFAYITEEVIVPGVITKTIKRVLRINLASGELATLSNLPEFYGDIAVRPDAQTALVIGGDPGLYQVFELNLRTGAFKVFGTEKCFEERPVQIDPTHALVIKQKHGKASLVSAGPQGDRDVMQLLN